MAANPVSRPFQPQIRHIAFTAQIPHLEELKQNDTSFNRTGVGKNSKKRSCADPQSIRPLFPTAGRKNRTEEGKILTTAAA
jgi:hypothetical protein